MNEFDIEKAKQGFLVKTKNGKLVEILKYDRNNKKFPVVAIIENKEVICYTPEGKYYPKKDSDNDLVTTDEKIKTKRKSK